MLAFCRFHPRKSCVVGSDLIWSGLVLFGLVWFGLVWFPSVSFHLVSICKAKKGNAKKGNPGHPTQHNTTQHARLSRYPHQLNHTTEPNRTESNLPHYPPTHPPTFPTPSIPPTILPPSHHTSLLLTNAFLRYVYIREYRSIFYDYITNPKTGPMAQR